MKKLKFVLPSLLSISLVPAICFTSCGTSEKKQSDYEWSIDGSNFNYQLISGKAGQEFKLEIVPHNGFAISTSSYFTINNGDQRELQLYDNVLTITPDKIDGKIDIHVVTVPLPNSISISYGEGQTGDVVLVEGETLDFNVTVNPIQYADSVKLVSQNENVAKFEGKTLVPTGTGNIWVKAVVDAYGRSFESNKINVDVQPKPITYTIDDDSVPLEAEPIYGNDEVGFLYRNFKANFNIKTNTITPSIVWNDASNPESASVQIANISNDRFNKSTFDIYISYDRDKYDFTWHLINIKLEILDVGQAFTSKSLIMSYKSSAESKTIDVSKVPKETPLIDQRSIVLTGFSTNFEFTGNGNDQITFKTTDNMVSVLSDNIINIVYDQTKKTTTFDLQLELLLKDLTDDEIGISIYLNNVYITTLNTKVNYGQIVLGNVPDYQVPFINGNKPYAESPISGYKTNFDFRVEGEPKDSKPLITAEWPAGISFPSPNKISIVRNETYTHEFGLRFEWNEPIDLLQYDPYYILTPIIKVNGVENPATHDFYSVIEIDSIRPNDLKTEVIMAQNKEGNSTLSLYAFNRVIVDIDDCDIKFQSNSPILKDSNPSLSIDEGSEIMLYDGIFIDPIKLEWDHPITITEPTKFSISVDMISESRTLLPWTEFTIVPPKPTNYWSIDTSGCQDSELKVIKNTKEEITLEIQNVTTGYKFFGASVKQQGYDFPQTINLDRLGENIITINPIQDDPTHSLCENAFVNISTIYNDPLDNQSNVYLNNYYPQNFLGSGNSGVKNDRPMTVIGNKDYYIDVDTKNWQFYGPDKIRQLNIMVGNIRNISTLFVRYMNPNTQLFVNGVAQTIGMRTMGNGSYYIYKPSDTWNPDIFKNLDIKILTSIDNDAMDCEFNLICVS